MSADPTDLLLYALRESNLLDAARLAELQDWATEYQPDSGALTKEVVRRGWLTAYQMREVGRGRGRDLVMGPYTLLDLLGEGGMGRVFKARHNRLGRDVALKVIRKEKLSKPIVVQRFHQEIRATAQLSHPNVVLAFDADEIDGVHFFAMEFVEGTDLTKLVKERGPVPVQLACDYIRQAALGLQHAYERGLVHRDVKPSNLLVTPRGQVKVLDLGLALLKENPGGDNAGRVTQDGFVLGTPDFLAPEQAQNPQGVDIRADVYGLGASLYFLLTGRVPYEVGSPSEKLMMHVTAPPPSLLQALPTAPPPLDAVLRWMMAKRPEERPQTPAQVAFALQPYCPAPSGTGPASGFLPPVAGHATAPYASPSGTPSSAYPVVPAQPAAVPMAQPVPYPAAPPAHYPPTGQPVPAAPMAAAPYPAPPPQYGYAPPASNDPFGFGGAETPAASPRSSRTRDDEPGESRGRSYRRPAGNSGGLKWIILGLVGVCGLGAVGGVGYVVLNAIQPEAPPPAEFENPAGMRMVAIPAGSFTMGSPDGETGRDADEGPAGEVTLSKPFSMSATEVTHGQFVKVMGRSPAKWPPKMRKGTDVPVDSVSWDEAVDFCGKLSLMDRNRRSGWAYRLPTEAEWEYACRAKSGAPFSSGDKLVLTKNAIFDLRKDREENSGYGEEDPTKGDVEKGLPYPVKSTEKNDFGLYDMHGNVWEWVQDRYASNYNDRAGTDPQGPTTGDWRVLRGGSWREPASKCRSAARKSMSPQARADDAGFRVVYAPVK